MNQPITVMTIDDLTRFLRGRGVDPFNDDRLVCMTPLDSTMATALHEMADYIESTAGGYDVLAREALCRAIETLERAKR